MYFVASILVSEQNSFCMKRSGEYLEKTLQAVSASVAPALPHKFSGVE